METPYCGDGCTDAVPKYYIHYISIGRVPLEFGVPRSEGQLHGPKNYFQNKHNKHNKHKSTNQDFSIIQHKQKQIQPHTNDKNTYSKFKVTFWIRYSLRYGLC